MSCRKEKNQAKCQSPGILLTSLQPDQMQHWGKPALLLLSATLGLSVCVSALGSHHLEHPRLWGFIGARHQPGQLHRAGGSFPLLSRDTGSQNPTVPLSCLDGCTQSLLPLPSQILDPDCLKPCQPPQHSSDGWRHFSGRMYPSLVLQIPC